MKYILILFFVIGCENTPKPEQARVGQTFYGIRGLQLEDTVMVYFIRDDRIIDSFLATPENWDSSWHTDKTWDRLYFKMLPSSDDTLKDYPITIHGGDSLLDTEGWWKGGITIPEGQPIRIRDTLTYGIVPDSIWITDNISHETYVEVDTSSWDLSKQVPWPIAVKDGKQYIATYDSLGNIYFKEK